MMRNSLVRLLVLFSSLQRAKQAAKQAAAQSSSAAAAETIDLTAPFASETAAANQTLPSSSVVEAAPVASPAASKPIGFGNDEDFISLKFDEDEEEAQSGGGGATPARGTKRKSFGGDATEGDDTPARRSVTEGAFRAPWACSAYTHPNFTLRLHEEILDFCTYVAPKPEEQSMREQLIGRIEAIAREAFPNAPNLQLRPFGSYATRLYLPISDIDLVLSGVDPYHATSPSMEKGKNSALALLERTMRVKQNATYLEHISGARIPILKFTDRETGVKIDICYEISGGIKAAEFIVERQREMPSLRPLTLFLKYFLHCRILNDTYKGGIGSFMLQLMLISHLQKLHFDGRLNQPTTNLGMLLMSFLECYGVSFNYKNAGLNTSVPDSAAASSAFSSRATRTSFFNKAAKGWFNANRPYLLSIENPLDASHDVGSNSYLIMRVRKALQFAYQVLGAHVHYEAQSRERGEKKRNQRRDLTADPAHPFAGASHTPQTLLSHIVSVNEEIRPGQEEVEYEEMEAELSRDEEQRKRAKQVHRIVSSSDDDDDDDVRIVPQPSFGDADLDSSDSDDDDASDSSDNSSDIDAGLEDGEVDERGEMARFEKRFQVDKDDEGDSDELPSGSSDDQSDAGSGSEDSDDDAFSGDDLAMDVSDAEYDDGEVYKSSRRSHGRSSSRSSRSSPPSGSSGRAASRSSPSPGDFIPLSGGGAKTSSSHNSHSSKSKKSKKKSMLRGHRTGGTKPNNQIFESNRSKKRKQSKKKQQKQQRG